MKKLYLVGGLVLGLLVFSAVGYYIFTLVNKNGVSDISSNGNIPSACSKTQDIIVKYGETDTFTPTQENSNFVKYSKDYGLLVFANYDANLSEMYSDVTEGRVLAAISLVQTDGSELTKGTYTYNLPIEENTDSKQAREFMLATKDITGGIGDPNAQVEVTYVDDKFICGNVNTDDSVLSIKGNFVISKVKTVEVPQ
jgi:hypothetical protein